MPVRVRDVGRAIDSVENDKIASWFNGERGITLAIQRQPGTNTVAVVDAVKALLPSFRAQMPASVQLDILFDRSVSIRDSVNDVQFTLVVTVALVVLVIFLFLRRLSATVIPSLALPMSIVGTFAVMYMLGYSLDNLSLMALTLSVGFVVDDAIVMLENIVRHVEHGETVMEAALEGSREIGFTILSMTVSLAAVFLPVLFMGGLLGRLLHEFAVTISVAILVSGFVSLTLTPMLCSRFLKPHDDQKNGRFYVASERVFAGWLALYDRSLKAVLRHPAATMVVSVLLLVGTVLLFRVMPTGFLPSEDTGQIFAITEAAQGVSFDAMAAHQKQVAAIVGADPNVERVHLERGRERPNATVNAGRIFMRLKPREERRLSVDDVIAPAAAEGRRRPRHPGLPPEPAADPRRRHAHEEPVPVHAAGPRHRGALPRRPGARGEAARAAGARRRDERPPDQEPAGARADRPRPRPRPRRQRAADRGRALHRLRHAPGLDDLRAQQPVPGDHGAAAAVPARPGVLACSTCARRAGPWCRSRP